MTTITIHNQSQLSFDTIEGVIRSGSILEVSKTLGEKLLKSYPRHLREVANSKKKDAEISKLKAQVKSLKSKPTLTKKPEEETK